MREPPKRKVMQARSGREAFQQEAELHLDPKQLGKI